MIQLNQGGQRTVNLITKNDQGQIVNIQNLDAENIGFKFRNETLVSNNDQNTSFIVVKDEKGRTASVQALAFPKTFVYAETEPGKRMTMVNQLHSNFKLKDRSNTIHYLPKMQLGNKSYSQVIMEEPPKNGKKRVTIHTLN